MKLNNSPEDGITSLTFHSTNSKLLATSWDKTLRLYNVDSNALLQKINQKAAILDGAFFGPQRCVSGGLQKRVFLTNIETSQNTTLGQHESPVRCVETSEKANLIFSGGWDNSVRIWDHRSVEPMVQCIKTGGKVYAMAVSNDFLVVSTSDRKNHIFELKNLDKPLEVRESSLRQQIRNVKINPDGKSFASSSTEGRVAIDYIAPTEKKGSYAFKCHRVAEKENNVVRVYPVNAISFHPQYCTFATGGCDGSVNVWDSYNKKRVSQLGQFPMGISSLCFNGDGSKMAIAVSYTWENSEQSHPPDYIWARDVKDKEVRRKSKL